jgi:hypothetical protein
MSSAYEHIAARPFGIITICRDSSQTDTASALDTTETLNVDPNQETANILPVLDGFDLM